MAKETIERIREAEKAAAQSQSDAKREAEKQIADAGKKTKELEEGIVAKARDEEKESELPELKKDMQLKVKEMTPNQHFTQPPARYTEASLIKAMEEYGVL